MADLKLVIRVHFVDDSFKTLAVSANVSAKDLGMQVAQKIDLTATQTFALFYRKNGEERCLEDDEQPCLLMIQEIHGVGADMNQYTERMEWEKLRKEWEKTCSFVYKRRVFLKNKPIPRDDPVFVRYSFIQAVADVIDGTYPCSQAASIELAGLQMQVTFRDHNKKIHVKGFLKDKLPRFIPAPLLNANLKKPEEWEEEVFNEHARLIGLQSLDAMLSYLNHVRNWSFYGSSFWTVQTVNKGEQLPDQVVLAVNSNGIQLLKTGTKETIMSHRYSDIYSWAYKRNAFAFVSGALSKQKFQFATPYGKDIARTLQAYVDILLEEYKAEKNKKAEPSEGGEESREEAKAKE